MSLSSAAWGNWVWPAMAEQHEVEHGRELKNAVRIYVPQLKVENNRGLKSIVRTLLFSQRVQSRFYSSTRDRVRPQVVERTFGLHSSTHADPNGLDRLTHGWESNQPLGLLTTVQSVLLLTRDRE